MPLPDTHIGLEYAVSWCRLALRVGTVVDTSESLQVLGVILRQFGRVADDQGVVGDQCRGPLEQFGSDGVGLPVLAGEVAAEPLLGGVDVAVPTAEASYDGGQVDVSGDHQPGNHVVDEVLSS